MGSEHGLSARFGHLIAGSSGLARILARAWRPIPQSRWMERFDGLPTRTLRRISVHSSMAVCTVLRSARRLVHEALKRSEQIRGCEGVAVSIMICSCDS
jgi:hypothetical protein